MLAKVCFRMSPPPMHLQISRARLVASFIGRSKGAFAEHSYTGVFLWCSFSVYTIGWSSSRWLSQSHATRPERQNTKQVQSKYYIVWRSLSKAIKVGVMDKTSLKLADLSFSSEQTGGLLHTTQITGCFSGVFMLAQQLDKSLCTSDIWHHDLQ